MYILYGFRGLLYACGRFVAAVVCCSDGSVNAADDDVSPGSDGIQRKTYGTVVSDQEARSLTRDFHEFAFEHSSDALKLCAVYAIGYIGFAIIAFSFVFEQWSIIDSVYFAIVTFTTIGFGDYTPSTEAGKIFTILFALYGTVILGIMLGIIGHAISETRQRALQNNEQGKRRNILRMLFSSSGDSDLDDNEHHAPVPRTLQSHVHCLRDDILEITRLELPIILIVVLLACLLGYREGWPISTSIYFCVISATTTGFGDTIPTSEGSRFFCVLFLPFAVAVFGEILARIASVYIRRKNHQAEARFLRQSVTLCDLRAMDADHNGMVSMEEFLCFMLVALQKVDQESIDELKRIFRSLDVTETGMLEKGDLIELAKRKHGVDVRHAFDYLF